MATTEKQRRVGLLLAAGAVAVGLLASGSRTKPVLPSVATTEMDVKPRAVAAIPPGTEIVDRPPKDWTHLIVKTSTRVGPDSIPKVSATTVRMTSLLFTAMVARVEGRQIDGLSRFHLAQVAVGVGTTVQGHDIVLSSETQKQLGADLGILDRTVLSGGEEQLQLMRCVARSPTMMILDAPSFMVYNKKHHNVVIRYALLVDPATGALEPLVWALEEERTAGAVPLGPVEWLGPNLMQDCLLHVDTDEYILGMPVKKAFAVYSPPPGRVKLTASDSVQRLLAVVPPLTPNIALAIEKGLRDLMAAARAR